MKKKSMIEQYRELSKAQKKENRRRFLAYILTYKFAVLLILLATSLLIIQASLVPKLTQVLIDDWLPQSNSEIVSNEAIKMVIGILIGILVLVLVKTLATFLSTFFVRRFQQNIEMDLKLDIYRKALHLDVAYFDKVNEGYFLSRINNDTTMAAEYARYIPENVLNVVISASINFSFIFIYSWIVGVAIVFLLIILFLVTFFARRFFIKNYQQVRASHDRFNQFLVNSFAGVRETKAYSWEKNELNLYQKVADNYQQKRRRSIWLFGRWMTFNALILGLLTTTIWALGSWQVIEHKMTIGQLTALTMYGVLIIEPINKLLAIFDLFMRGSVALSRIFGILDEKEEAYQGGKIVIKEGKIEFKDVFLSYNDKTHALNGVSFVIKPGEKVAFVGSTGSGKSTILKSLVNFYRPQKGKILIDDQNIAKVSVASLRQNITLMAQEPYIFFDSIKQNIIFGNANIDEETYQAAKSGAQVDDFVNSLDEKDQTNIGPRGIALSGGQKQRVALARAFLKNSQIILFDEATSALDNQTESLIKKQIKTLSHNKTTIFVAHRLTTIQDVDRIFVLEKGKIVEIGSHQELLAKQGKYYQLVKASHI